VLCGLVLAWSAAVQALPKRHSCSVPADCHVLLTTDDTVDAPGVSVLYQTLLAAGYQVTLVGPAQDSSQTSGSLSVITPGETVLYSEDPDNLGIWSVEGTPVEAVTIGLTLIAEDVDVVVAGINIGQNLGKSGVLSSGTVGAALRATNLGFPAIAVSIAVLPEENPTFPSTVQSLQPGAEFVIHLLKYLAARRFRLLLPGTLMNVNLPAPFDGQNRAVFTRLAEKSNFEFVYAAGGEDDESGKQKAVLGVTFPEDEEELAGDTEAINNGLVSLSLLSSDLSIVWGPHRHRTRPFRLGK